MIPWLVRYLDLKPKVSRLRKNHKGFWKSKAPNPEIPLGIADLPALIQHNFRGGTVFFTWLGEVRKSGSPEAGNAPY